MRNALLALVLISSAALGQAKLAPCKMDGSDCGTSGSGTVTITGTPTSGQVALVSGATSVTGDAGLAYDSETDVLTAGGFAGPATAIKSASTSVDVSAATAPSANQVLTATDSTHATWATLAVPEAFNGVLAAGTATVPPLRFTSGVLLTNTQAGAVEFNTDSYYATISSSPGATITTQLPPVVNDNTYVRVSSTYFTYYQAWMAINTGTSLTGIAENGSWKSGAGSSTNQRYHIDLGSAKTIKRVYYENYHWAGDSESTGDGVKNFTFWGSNTPGSFEDTAYANDAGWVQLATDVAQMDRHVNANVADPKYINVTNSTAYRYYAFKLADAWGGAVLYGIGFRRIELQTVVAGDPYRKPIVLADAALTSGRIPYTTTNGRLTDGLGITTDGTNVTVTGNVIAGGFTDSAKAANLINAGPASGAAAAPAWRAMVSADLGTGTLSPTFSTVSANTFADLNNFSALYYGSLFLGSARTITWKATDSYGGLGDAGFSRASAGLLSVTSGGSNLGSLQAGNLTATALATPAITSPLTVNGTPGATTYGYKAVAFLNDGSHTAASPEVTVATGPAALGVTDNITIAWPAVANQAYSKLYRTTPLPIVLVYSGTAPTYLDVGTDLGAAVPETSNSTGIVTARLANLALTAHADNTAALAAGLVAGDLYYTDVAGEYVIKMAH